MEPCLPLLNETQSIPKNIPGKIIAINVKELNESGGGIHCATMQQPARG